MSIIQYFLERIYMQNSQENNEQFSPPCVDNSTFLEENLTENADNLANSQQTTDFSSENSEKPVEGGDNSAKITIEMRIDKDFADFEVIYPNVSRKSLLEDENLRIFAEGKENKPLSVIYAQYRQIVGKIEAEAIRQEKARQNNALSSVGGLSSANSGEDAYFTREQVLKMSQSEIKRNFNLIRESQARW